ncbi:MAG: ArnT family glycosyltransferase [Actinomycetes bacterium]
MSAADTTHRWSRWDTVALCAIGIVLVLPLVGLLRYQGPPMEEGFMLVFPERILRGAYPHRDFLHLYGPGSLWLLAGVYKVFGVHLTVERLVGFLQHAAVGYGLFFLLRPWGRRIATSAAIVAVVVLIGPLGLSAMAWNGALAFSVWGLVVGVWAGWAPDATRGRRLALLSGLLVACALLYRPDMVIAAGAGAAALAFGMTSERRRRFAVGVTAGLLLYVPHLWLAGPSAAFRGMFLEPVFELRGGRSLPIPPSWSQTDGFLQRAGELRLTGWPLPMLAPSKQIALWFFLVLASCVLIVMTAWRVRRIEPATRRSQSYWPAALFGAALVQQALQRPDTAHLSWVSGITFPLSMVAVSWIVARWRPRWDDGRAQLLGVGAVVVVLAGVIPFYPARTYVDLVGQSFGRNRFGAPIRNDGRTFYFGSASGAADAQRVVDALDRAARPGQSLVVGPTDLSRTNYSDAYFYYLFPKLRPGTRYIEMDPGLADSATSALPRELERVDWLVLSAAWDDWSEPNDSANGRSQRANRVVERNFCLVVRTPTYSLFRRYSDGTSCPPAAIP